MLVCCEICGCIFSDRDPVCPLCKHSTEFSRRVRAFGGSRVIPEVLFSVFIFLTASAITVGLVEYSKRFSRPTGPVILDLDGVKPARFTARAQVAPGRPAAHVPQGTQVARTISAASETAAEPLHKFETIPAGAAAPPHAAELVASRSARPSPVMVAARPVEASMPARASAVRRPHPSHLPEYELLHAAREYGSNHLYAEVLVPSLSPTTPAAERSAIMRAIAQFEGFENGTLYCTRQAREAQYSMDYADRNPQALSQGLLGTYQHGHFEPYKSK